VSVAVIMASAGASSAVAAAVRPRRRRARLTAGLALVSAVFLSIVAAGGAVLAQSPAASVPELTVPDFLSRLDALRDASRAAATPADAAALADALPPAWTVRVGPERVQVPAGGLVSALKDPAWPTGRDRAAAIADAIHDEASRLAAASAPPPAHLRRTLSEILADPEFRGRGKDDLMMRWAERIRDWLRSWLPSLPDAPDAVEPVLTWTSGGIAVLAFLVLALVVWRTLRRASWDTARQVRPASAAPGDPADARAWAARARAAAASGDAREAIRCAYHAVLHRLDEDGVWRIEDARTPREYLRLVPAHDARQPAVAAVARLFEGTWYGGRQPGPGDAQAAIGRLGELGCDAQPDPAI
jgi:hypothetical protein